MGNLGPKAAFFKDTMIMGGRSEAGLPAARVGGMWLQPNYALAYLLAARYVIEKADEAERVDETCLPAAYLQRHALELALKQLIGLAYEIESDGAWLKSLEKNAGTPKTDARSVKFGHTFSKIVEQADEALATIGFDPLPDEVRGIATRLADVEVLEHTRLRYPEITNGEASFPSVTDLPVGEIQLLLEAVFEEFLVYQPDADGQENLTTQLCWESEALTQAIVKIVGV